MNETEKIVAEEYEGIVLGLELEKLAANYTFSETDKSRFNEINKLTSEVNKEVAAEMRKQQKMGIFGIDLSASSSYT